jgi:hypothetical protein
MTHTPLKTYLSLLMLFVISLALVACGGSGSGMSDTTSGTGSVGIVLTDGPTADFDEVNVTITEIKLIAHDGYNNNDNVVIFQGEETVDLLNLTDFSALFALNNNVPAGEYEKIRLQLKQPNGIELVKKDAQGNIVETIYPKMSGNGKLDLNPRGHFYVAPNQTLYIQMDIDANKSLHIVQTGNGGYRFRPVVFVDIIGQQFNGKLVRHFGYVHDMDMLNNRFKLCDTPVMVASPTSSTSSTETSSAKSLYSMDGCIKVTAANASVFNESGEPVDLSGIEDNQMLTAIGFVRSYDDEGDGNDNNGLESESSGDGNDQGNEGTSSTDSRHVYDHDHSIRLYAEVIELGDEGTFAVVDGTIASEPQTEADAFGLTLEDTSEISVQLQTGTKVFSRSGQRLDYQGIDMGLTTSVDGVYSAMDNSILNSALVIVDTAMTDSMEQITGQVLAVDTVNKIITISTESGDKMIRLSDSSSIFLLLDDGTGALSSVIDLVDVPTDVRLDAYGYANTDGYFDADTVIVESPQSTP